MLGDGSASQINGEFSKRAASDFSNYPSIGHPALAVCETNKAGPRGNSCEHSANCSDRNILLGILHRFLLVSGMNGCSEQTELPARAGTPSDAALARMIFTLGGTSFALS